MNEFCKKYKEFLKEHPWFLDGITDSSFYDLVDWYDYCFNPKHNEDDPACDEAQDFATYVWDTYLHQIDYNAVNLGDFDISKVNDVELCTNDLRKAKVVCVNSDDIIVSISDFNGDELIIRYNKEGKPCNEKYDADYYNLHIVKKKHVGYINLFDIANSGLIVTSNVFNTKEEAKADIKKPDYYIDTIRIEFYK